MTYPGIDGMDDMDYMDVTVFMFKKLINMV